LATSQLHAKELIGAVAEGRLGFDCKKMRCFSSECDTNRCSMVVDEIKASEEEWSVAQAVSQAQK